MWLTKLTTWLGNFFSAYCSFQKSAFEFLLTKVYLLILPLFAVCKLVFDLCRVFVNRVITLMQTLGDGFHGSITTLPDCISFVNYFFPIDEIFICCVSLFTFFIACQIIATLRGIKQTLLF